MEAFEDDKRTYYDDLEISEIEEDEDEEAFMDESTRKKLRDAVDQETKIKINAKKFLETNQEYSIPHFNVHEDDDIVVTEYAPKIFKNIRQGFITEKILFDSLVPS